jgi:voltage-gated potassium channel
MKTQGIAAVLALVSLILTGTIVYKYLEDWTWDESFYFTVVTISTVGYGDLHPTTALSRTFTALFIIAGVAIGLAALSTIGSGYLTKREERVHRRRSKKSE